MPKPGVTFSGSFGETLEQSAAGVPHGFIRVATVAQIRANNGVVVYKPEMNPQLGTINRQHVDVIEGGAVSVFGELQPNPVSKRKRFGGPEYRDLGLLL